MHYSFPLFLYLLIFFQGAWSCTLYATSLTSSSVIVYSRASLCAFIFFCNPPIYTTDLFWALDCVGCVVPWVSGMSPPACPYCTRMFSFFYVEPLMGVVESFCCVISLGIGLFFVVKLPLVDFFFCVVLLV
jgi:hypothetical protein